jgi:hypothetical protein
MALGDLVKDVPIPFHLSKNDRDRRDLPIPFIVYRDIRGVPHFTVDDIGAVTKVLAEKLCGLCGEPLKTGEMWLIGGPVSAFLEDGMFTTPHAHEECARYSIQVCPFLAAPVYTKLIEARTLKPEAVHDTAQFHHDQITPPRPAFMVLACTASITLIDADDGSGKKYIIPHRPWKEVEFWKNGERVTQAEAEKIAQAGELPPSQLKWWPA